MTEDVSSGAGQATAPATEPSVSAPTSTPAGEPAPASTGNATWKDSLPEDLRGHKSLEKFKEPGDIFKSYTELEKVISNKTIGVPTAESSEEEWGEFYSKIRPESAEAYNLEGFTEGDIEVWSKAFHENGLSEKQAQNLYELYKGNYESKQAEMYSEEGFNKVVQEVFGDDTASYDTVRNNLKDSLSDESKAVVDKMPNQFVKVMYEALNANLKAYGANEGGALNQPADKQVLSESQINDKRTELRQKMNDMKSRPHNREEYDKLLSELTATYQGGKK